MATRTRNIVLIGMPGSGKSTIGRRLANFFGLSLIDTDDLLEASANMPIQEIVDKRGLAYFMQLEEHVLNTLQVQNSVIATGGSAVYSDAGMRNLKQSASCVYLYITLPTMLQRVNNADQRGLVKLPQHSLQRLYADRQALFSKHADITFDNNSPLSALTMDRLQQQIMHFEAA